MYYVYMLRCGDGSLYTGSTNNLEKRFKAHSSGNGARYTRSHLPVTPVYAEPVGSRSDALKRELQVKACSRAQKLLMLEAEANLLKHKEPEDADQ